MVVVVAVEVVLVVVQCLRRVVHVEEKNAGQKRQRLVTASISYFVHFADRIQNTEHFTHPIFRIREITASVHAQKAHKKNPTDNIYIAQIEQ